MSTRILSPIVFLALIGDAAVSAPMPPTVGQCAVDAALVAELEQRNASDQLRLVAWKLRNEQGPDSSEANALWVQQDRIDADNLTWLQAQVRRGGWPRQCAVGPEGSRTAFLIAQHGDLQARRDLEEALTDAVRHGDAAASHLAYLQDRNLVEDGKPQIYGTQWNAEGELFPVTDPEHMEQRRAAIGLGPAADYRSR